MSEREAWNLDDDGWIPINFRPRPDVNGIRPETVSFMLDVYGTRDLWVTFCEQHKGESITAFNAAAVEWARSLGFPECSGHFVHGFVEMVLKTANELKKKGSPGKPTEADTPASPVSTASTPST